MRTIAVSPHELTLPECGPHSVLAAAPVFQSPNQLTRLLLTQILAAKPLTLPSETARTAEKTVLKTPALQEEGHLPNSRGGRVTEIGVLIRCLPDGGTSITCLTLVSGRQ